MRVRLYHFLLIAVMSASAAAALLSLAYHSMAAFSGTIAVTTGNEESVVIAPASTAGSFETRDISPNLPAKNIPFQDKKAADQVFANQDEYRALRLPFPVKLEKIEAVSAPPAENFIKISGPPEETLKIKQGTKAQIGGAPFIVKSIAKWSGLLRDPQGIPMAAVTISEEGDFALPTSHFARFFLASGVWQKTPGGAAVHFVWHEGDARAARAAAAAGPPGIESARWGVIDRGAVNWFTSFTPGAGAFLSDGAEVTLVAFDEKRPALAVEIKRGGKKDTFWVAANETVEGAPVLFDYPALAPRVYTIHAWQDGRALVTAFERGGEAAQKELRPRETLAGLRLDNVLSSAVPVAQHESTLWAAVVQSESGREAVLRQGEAKRLEDCRVEYVRRVPPRVVNYILTIPGTNKRNVSLKPGQSLRVGHWRLSHASQNAPANVALLTATYAPAKTFPIIFAAIAIAALALRLTLAFRKPRPA